jgi:RNA polymerase sigma factor (sigma-70 family)
MSSGDSNNGDGKVARLFAQRGASLAAFFRRRAKTVDESADLTQETFLRVLRADSGQAIRNPEAYLFAVAGNLAREHALLGKRFGDAHDATDVDIEHELADWCGPDDLLDATLRTQVLQQALTVLSPKCRAAVILQYRDGLTYAQIGERLGVSSHMVKKYLATALQKCREHFADRKDVL